MKVDSSLNQVPVATFECSSHREFTAVEDVILASLLQTCVCLLLQCASATVKFYLSRTVSQIALFHTLAWVMIFYHSNRKFTNISISNI